MRYLKAIPSEIDAKLAPHSSVIAERLKSEPSQVVADDYGVTRASLRGFLERHHIKNPRKPNKTYTNRTAEVINNKLMSATNDIKKKLRSNSITAVAKLYGVSRYCMVGFVTRQGIHAPRKKDDKKVEIRSLGSRYDDDLKRALQLSRDPIKALSGGHIYTKDGKNLVHLARRV